MVTGHTGFKGSWLAFLLHEIGAEVLGYALPPAYADSHFEKLDLARSIRHVEGDVRDGVQLASVMSQYQPEFVFHLAAQAMVRTSYADPKTAGRHKQETNTETTRQTLHPIYPLLVRLTTFTS